MSLPSRLALAALFLLLSGCGSGGGATLAGECPVLVGLNAPDTVELSPGDTVRVAASLHECEPPAGG